MTCVVWVTVACGETIRPGDRLPLPEASGDSGVGDGTTADGFVSDAASDAPDEGASADETSVDGTDAVEDGGLGDVGANLDTGTTGAEEDSDAAAGDDDEAGHGRSTESEAGGCAPGELACDGGCVPNGVQHCGGCDVECSGATPVCSKSGANPMCVSGCTTAAPTLCGGACVDTSRDPNNCGTCGHACTTEVSLAQPACDAGACSFACNAPYSECDGGCVDEQTDKTHCGGCDIACAGGNTCQAGACGCPSGTHECTGVCESNTSVDSCGIGCNTLCPGPTNGSAYGSAACNGTVCTLSCASGLSACGGACVNEMTDKNNCGLCKTNCATCLAGRCVNASTVAVCGRGSNGIDCAVAGAATFQAYSLREAGFGDANGWAAGPEYFSTIRFADVNGDANVDACGRGSNGIDCALSNGASFTGYSLWADGFSDANGWNAGPEYYSTIAFADINGDGKTDVCGRGVNGIDCGLSNGATFTGYSLWGDGFSDANGWNAGPEYYSTIQFVDFDGDGKADVCGRGINGIDCAVSNGTGFTGYSLWGDGFSDANGWNRGPEYYSTIRFVDINGDGKVDVCGRGSNGIDCALSNGTALVGYALWASGYSDAAGWSSGSQYYSTIRFADLNGDQLVDVCGRGSNGIDCALSNGASFTGYSLWADGFSDANGWNAGAQYYSTIQFADPLGVP